MFTFSLLRCPRLKLLWGWGFQGKTMKHLTTSKGLNDILETVKLHFGLLIDVQTNRDTLPTLSLEYTPGESNNLGTFIQKDLSSWQFRNSHEKALLRVS